MTNGNNDVLPEEQSKNLGTGLVFTSMWDFDVYAGSINVSSGLSILNRDLAFEFSRQLDNNVRGDILNADTKDDIRVLVRRILEDDSRILDESYVIKSIEELDSAGNDIRVTVEATAITDERGEFILEG